MNKIHCFPADSLKDYLAGELDDSVAADIERHLAQCAACEQTIVGLESEPDTMIELLRLKPAAVVESSAGPKSETPEASIFVNAYQQAKELMNEAQSVGASQQELGRWLPPTTEFGAYELLKPLGRGGMATVFLARHRQLGKLVAIKILPAPTDPEQQSALRFQREIRAAGCLNHPSIVLATDAGDRDGLHYLVMEYIEGLDLSRLARTVGPLRIADACELGRQVALGLSHAHAAGIVHRDIKPSNLMLDVNGRTKILDFGLAQVSLWDEAASELTTVGQLMGTLDYMAPEQAERSGSVDYRADLYALGATLFRLLCGRAPLAASPNLSPLEKLRMLASHDPPRLDTLRPDAPAELVELVSSLLARAPESRPASAAHVAERLAPLATEANLCELAKQAQEAQANAAAAKQPNAIQLEPARVSNIEHASPLALTSSASTPKRNRLRNWLVAAAFLPLLVYAGVLIVIQTQQGQLVIESEVADVQVKLHQDGKPDREMTLHPGVNTTKLFAGQYEVTLASPSDSITLDNGKIAVRKGETVIARVQQKKAGSNDSQLPPATQTKTQPSATPSATRPSAGGGFSGGFGGGSRGSSSLDAGGNRGNFRMQPQPASAVPQPASVGIQSTTGAPASGPTYEGKPLNVWMSVVKNDRSHATLYSALSAVSALVDESNAEQITRHLLDVLYASDAEMWNRSVEQKILYSRAVGILAKANPGGKFGEVIIGELEKVDAKSASKLLSAIKHASNNDILNPVLKWLATSPVSQAYSQDVLNSLSDLLTYCLTYQLVSPVTKQLAYDAALSSPNFGRLFLFKCFLRGDKFNGHSLLQNFPTAIRDLAKSVLEDEKATSAEVTSAACTLAVWPNIQADSTDLLEPIHKRLDWLSHNPDRILAFEDTRISTGEFARYHPVGFAGTTVAFHGNVIASRFGAQSSYWDPPAWIDEGEVLALLELVKRLSLVGTFAEEFGKIQAITTAGRDEVTKLLSTIERRPETPITWPFGETEMAPIPEKYRSVSQKSWIAFAIYELIAVELKNTAKESPSAQSEGAKSSADAALHVAASVIAKYDKNGDRVLTVDEWSHMIVKPADADTNGDGTITVEEYAAFRQRKK